MELGRLQRSDSASLGRVHRCPHSVLSRSCSPNTSSPNIYAHLEQKYERFVAHPDFEAEKALKKTFEGNSLFCGTKSTTKNRSRLVQTAVHLSTTIQHTSCRLCGILCGSFKSTPSFPLVFQDTSEESECQMDEVTRRSFGGTQPLWSWSEFSSLRLCSCCVAVLRNVLPLHALRSNHESCLKFNVHSGFGGLGSEAPLEKSRLLPLSEVQDWVVEKRRKNSGPSGAPSIAFLYFLRLYCRLQERAQHSLSCITGNISSQLVEQEQLLDQLVFLTLRWIQHCLKDVHTNTQRQRQEVSRLLGAASNSRGTEGLSVEETSVLLDEWRHIEHEYVLWRLWNES